MVMKIIVNIIYSKCIYVLQISSFYMVYYDYIVLNFELFNIIYNLKIV